MSQRLTNEMSIAELCAEALKLSPLFPDYTTVESVGRETRSEKYNQWFRYCELIRDLKGRGYQTEVIDRASALILAQLKDVLVRLIAEENDLAQKDIKVNQLLTELSSTWTVINAKTGDAKLKRAHEILEELKPLVEGEINLTQTMQQLETELKRLIDQVEKTG